MDVDTQTRITTLYKPFHPASYLCHHTPLLTPKHTNTPPDRRAGKEGSQYLKSYLALWLQIRLLLWPMGKLWSLLHGMSLKAESYCSFYHFITFDYGVSLCLDKRKVQPGSYTLHTCISRFLKCSVTT